MDNESEKEPEQPTMWLRLVESLRHITTPIQLVAFVVLLFFFTIISPLVQDPSKVGEGKWLLGLMGYGAVVLIGLFVLVLLDKSLAGFINVRIDHHRSKLEARLRAEEERRKREEEDRKRQQEHREQMREERKKRDAARKKQNALEGIIKGYLTLNPAMGMDLQEIRTAVGPAYTDNEIALAVDNLKRRELESLILNCLPWNSDEAKSVKQIINKIGMANYTEDQIAESVRKLNEQEIILRTIEGNKYFKSIDEED